MSFYIDSKYNLPIRKSTQVSQWANESIRVRSLLKNNNNTTTTISSNWSSSSSNKKSSNQIEMNSISN